MWLDGFRCSKQCRCLKDDDGKGGKEPTHDLLCFICSFVALIHLPVFTRFCVGRLLLRGTAKYNNKLFGIP